MFEEGEVVDDTTMTMPLPGHSGVFRMAWSGEDRMVFASGTSPSLATDVRLSVLGGDLRKLLQGWHNVFLHHNQELGAAANHPEQSSDELRSMRLCASSRRYRAEIQDFLELCQRRLSSPSELSAIAREYGRDPNDDAFVNEYLQYCSLLEAAKVAWHLVEIFFFDPNFNVTAQLVNWFQTAEAIPTWDERTGSEDEFWHILYKLTVQGRVEHALDLLASAAQPLFTGNEQDLTLIRELLQSIPSVQSAANQRWSEKDFQQNFASWQVGIRNLRAAVNTPTVTKLLDILSGDGEALLEFSDVWTELLVARLLFVDPSAGKDKVILYARDCQNQIFSRDNQFGGFGADQDDALIPFHQLLMSIMMEDSDSVIHQMHQMFESTWLTAHLADLFYHSGHLESVVSGSQSIDLREKYVLEYAATLVSHCSLWQVAVSYLATCPIQGKSYLRLLVSSHTSTTPRHVHKLIEICDVHGLSEEKRALERAVGLSLLKRGNFGGAVHWFLAAHDINLVNRVCEQVLERHFSSDERPMDDIDAVVDNMGEVPACDELGFLCKYRDLVERTEQLKQPDLSDEERFVCKRDAIEIVVRLLDSRAAPQKYWFLLLRHAVIHLEDTYQPVVLSSNDISKLMSCLEHLVVSHRSDKYITDSQKSEIDLLRLSLGQRLVDSYIAEMSC